MKVCKKNYIRRVFSGDFTLETQHGHSGCTTDVISEMGGVGEGGERSIFLLLNEITGGKVYHHTII